MCCKKLEAVRSFVNLLSFHFWSNLFYEAKLFLFIVQLGDDEIQLCLSAQKCAEISARSWIGSYKNNLVYEKRLLLLF